jgi:outer membrane protein assembly factor BamB
MSRGTQVIGIAVAVALGVGAHAFAQDWPQWRGQDRDGKVADFEAPAEWPTEFTRIWSVNVGAGDSTPALVGDRLYLLTRQGSEEVAMCVDAATGDVLWEDRYAAQAVTGPASRHPGPRSSPAVVDGGVVVMGATGIVSCLDAATGEAVWRNASFEGQVPRFFTGMSPIVVDGVAVLHLGGPDSGVVMAFDLESGDPRWTWSGDAPAYGSPVLMTVGNTKIIVAQTAEHLVGINSADGALLWQVAARPQRRNYNSATPLVEGQTVVYTGQGTGTRAVEIHKEGDTFAVKELWANPDLGTGFNTPVIKDGLIFGLSRRGNLYCMNAQNGETIWVDPVERERFAALVDAGSVILVLPSDGVLIAFAPSNQGYQELARVKVANTPVYAHPVIAGKRILVKDQESLTLWEVS